MVAVLVVVAISSGCGSEAGVETRYGQSRGRVGRESISGTATLAALARRRGNQMAVTGRLSPRLDRQDTIVWFPQQGLPSEKTIEYFETWLQAEPNRTLVVVNRGYDLQHSYSRRAARLAETPHEADTIRRHGARILADELADRRRLANSESCAWFSVQHARIQPQICERLRGPLLLGIEADRCRLQWVDRFHFPAETFERKTLLADGNIPLVTLLTKPDWIGSRLLVVSHSAFLLNLELTNRHHRQLAAKLMNYFELSEGSTRIAFLETDTGSPPTATDTPPRTTLSMLYQWPLCILVWHAFAAGMIFCMVYFPYLGRPRPEKAVPLTDFGRHVSALGQLLAATRDDLSARRELHYYFQAAQHVSPDRSARPIRRKDHHA